MSVCQGDCTAIEVAIDLYCLWSAGCHGNSYSSSVVSEIVALASYT